MLSEHTPGMSLVSPHTSVHVFTKQHCVFNATESALCQTHEDVFLKLLGCATILVETICQIRLQEACPYREILHNHW